MTVTQARQPLATPAVRPRSRFAHPALLLVGVLVVALNMRACLAAISPLVGEIQRSFGLSATASGLITTLPVLLQGAGAPLTPRLTRRYGTERVVLGAMLVLAVGMLLRVLPSVLALYAGCVAIGVAIAVLNVSIPELVKREFPGREASMIGVYSTAQLVGATLGAALSVPLEKELGGGWQASLAAWSLPAAFAAIAWLPQLLRNRQTQELGQAQAEPVSEARPIAGIWRSGLAWKISLFLGVNSLLCYIVVAWLPTILTDHGMGRGEAGLVFAFSNLVQVFGAFLTPVLAGRMTRQRGLAVATAVLNAAGFAWLLAAPVSGAWFSATLLGLAQGSAMGLGLAFIVLRTRTGAAAAQLGGMSQAVGYLVAASGPVGAGALHQLTGGWQVPLSLMLLLAAVAAAAGWGAGRNRTL